MKKLLMIIGSAWMVSCMQSNQKISDQLPGNRIVFARTLEIFTYSEFTLLKVTKPWQSGEREIFYYIAVQEDVTIPDSLSHLPVIRTPVKTVVTFSTTHIGFVSALGKTETITGISGKDYFYDPLLRERYKNGMVHDIGYPPSVDYETIVKLKPDVVFLYGLGASVAGVVKRLENVGVPAIMVSEFLEDHPLGKAEWIKLFAVLYGLNETGDSVFNIVTSAYNHSASLVKSISNKPKVLAGLPWKDTWFMAGGRSFTARLIEDAGGDYLWKNDTSSEFIPLSLEAVFMKSSEADVWINCGTAESISDLASRDKRFMGIKALKNGSVYNNNARLNEAGGNDFWESGTVRVDLILKDLIAIFHPGAIYDDELMYYKNLE